MDWEKRDSEIKEFYMQAPLDDVISNVGAIWCHFKLGMRLVPFDWQCAFRYGTERIKAELGKERFDQLMEKAWSDYECQ